MRFELEVHWGEDGVLVGEIAAPGESAVPFHGIVHLIGLLEGPLGPPLVPVGPGDRVDTFPAASSSRVGGKGETHVE